MGNIKFLYDNKLDDVTPTASTEALFWPVENVQKRWQSRSWRSAYGLRSSGGRFEITASNNKFYFYENSNATFLTATITVGTYDAESLATEINTQIEAVGSNTYLVSYNVSDFNFQIDLDTGTNFLINGTCFSGSNQIFDTIGITVAMTSWETSLTADEIRIHTSEQIDFNLGAVTGMDLVAIFGHNIQTSGELKVQMSNDNFTTTPVDVTPTRGTDLMVYVPASTTSYQYVRIHITDIDNPDGYVRIGRTWGGAFDYEPDRGFAPDHTLTPVDPSTLNRSEGGQINAILRPHYKKWDYSFEHIKEFAEFKAIFESRGSSRELVILEKESSAYTASFTDPEDYLWYCRITNFNLSHKPGRWTGKIKLESEL